MSVRNSEMTSRRAMDGGHQRAGSRGEGTQTDPHAEIVRLPAGSIAQIPRLKPSDRVESGLNEPLLLAILFLLNFWFGVALGIRALFF